MTELPNIKFKHDPNVKHTWDVYLKVFGISVPLGRYVASNISSTREELVEKYKSKHKKIVL